MSDNSTTPAGEPEAPIVREKTAAELEYERKLDRDMRILRVVFPVMCVITAILTIAMTVYLIAFKL